MLVALALACRQQEAVRIRRPADDHARTLQPWQLVHLTNRWYLVAAERGVDEWRTWALDRELRLATVELPGAARWVASHGFDVDVIEPDELRVQLAEFGA